MNGKVVIEYDSSLHEHQWKVYTILPDGRAVGELRCWTGDEAIEDAALRVSAVKRGAPPYTSVHDLRGAC